MRMTLKREKAREGGDVQKLSKYRR